MERSAFISTSAAVAACAVIACSPQADAVGLVEMPGEFDVAAFDAMVSKRAEARQVWDAGALHPRILGAVKNSLNGMQFGFALKREQVAVAFVAHGDSNLMLYRDAMWSKYRLGELFGVHDPAGNVVASNIFVQARTAADPAANPNDVRGFYQDASIETLQRRGVLFFACNTALVEQAERIVNAGAAKATIAKVADTLRKNLVPGVTLVPSGVAALALLQSRYRYAYATEQS